MKSVTFRQLRVFVEVARQLSFVRAAEALHCTPPAITMQVKELEAGVGLQLFHREGRSVSLTTTGEYFLVYARRLIATLKEAEDAMARFKRVEAGLLTIGLVSTAKYFVPRLLARFREQHPGIELRLSVLPNREQLVGLMGSNEVDLAIMGRPPKDLSTRAEPFAAHPLVFIGPPGHRLLQQGSSPLASLEREALIVREAGSGTRTAMEDLFREQRFHPQSRMEMSSNETIKQAVMAGMGVSFLSLHTLGLELRCGLLSVLPIDGTPVMRTWNLVRPSSKLLSPAAEAFRYFILEEGERHLAEHDRALLG
ncbi:LysR substrate-binding domain-containing protein [Aquabacterium sp. A7-Y]|uniref:LysR family transcriptional regulator n=1 Tax=Aquabacterium sp. A7-Y TaxID=1349605 RepID=UPI00223E5308|nr:LysR family transcriptional regulator [Aquabacterium sp. A7-Y]MCW7538624.1 LysR substrate-binding domain-containing protein [Aquabacterium sp. A7-Y]